MPPRLQKQRAGCSIGQSSARAMAIVDVFARFCSREDREPSRTISGVLESESLSSSSMSSSHRIRLFRDECISPSVGRGVET
eukprot:1124607-Rhodomonas_salina.1